MIFLPETTMLKDTKIKLGHVYMITSPSGRVYVGSTNRITKRWNVYKNLKCKQQVKLFHSFKKYGYENHIFEVIWSGNSNERLKYERLIGDYYEVLNPVKGMNLRLPGYDDLPSIVSDETRIKLSIVMTGKISKRRGTKCNEEIKLRMSISAKNKKVKSFLNKEAKENSRLKSIKPVICTKTGIEFESIKDAAIYCGIEYNYFRQQLSGRWKNQTTFIHKSYG